MICTVNNCETIICIYDSTIDLMRTKYSDPYALSVGYDLVRLVNYLLSVPASQSWITCRIITYCSINNSAMSKINNNID